MITATCACRAPGISTCFMRHPSSTLPTVTKLVSGRAWPLDPGLAVGKFSAPFSVPRYLKAKGESDWGCISAKTTMWKKWLKIFHPVWENSWPLFLLWLLLTCPPSSSFCGTQDTHILDPLTICRVSFVLCSVFSLFILWMCLISQALSSLILISAYPFCHGAQSVSSSFQILNF